MDYRCFSDDRIWPRRAALALVWLALLVAAVALAGSMDGRPLLASYRSGYISMAPITAICFISLAAALLIALRPAAGSISQVCAAIVGALVAAYGGVVWLAIFATNPNNSAENWAAELTELQFNPLAPMSPVTGALFVLAGVALAGLLVIHRQRTDARRWLVLAAATGSLVVAAATLIVVSYAIDAPLFYDSATLPMALPTAISFVLLGSGIIAMAVLCTPAFGRWSWRLADVSVATQLRAGLSGIVLAVLGFGYVVHLQKDVLWSQTRALYEHPLVVIRAAGELRVIAWRIHGSLRDLTDSSDDGDSDSARLAQDLDTKDAAVKSAMAILASAYLGPASDMAALKAEQARWHAACEALLRIKTDSADGIAMHSRLAADAATATLRVLDRIEVIAGFAEHKADLLYAEAERRNRALEAAVFVILAAVLLASGVVGWLLLRQISGPVRELTSVAAQFGQGKLDIRSESGSANEFGVLASTLNTMADTIEANVQAAALMTEQLRRSEASLAAQNKELDAFSYSVSHDLRAPLRSIDGFSRILLEDYEDKLDADGRDSLNRIRAATQRMAQLIDDLLRLSRLSRGELHYESVDLSAMVREIAAELSSQDPGRGVTLVVADGVMASGDRQLLRVALTNLLGNAWKFTSKRVDPRIEFGTRELDGRRSYFVRDNGVGFDPAYADKLFGAFQRLHGSSEFPGTGIGLATVLRVVRRHGGSVWADSAVDQGATFSFELDSQAAES